MGNVCVGMLIQLGLHFSLQLRQESAWMYWVAAIKGIYCPVHVSSNHCPIEVRIVIQHSIVRDEWRIIELERFDPALRHRLPEQVTFVTVPICRQGYRLVRYGRRLCDSSVFLNETGIHARLPAYSLK